MISNPLTVTGAFNTIQQNVMSSQTLNVGAFAILNNAGPYTSACQLLMASSVTGQLAITGIGWGGASIVESIQTSSGGVQTVNYFQSVTSIQNIGATTITMLSVNTLSDCILCGAFLDSVAMSGASIQTNVSVATLPNNAKYSIVGTILPLFNLPTYSGTTTGAFTMPVFDDSSWFALPNVQALTNDTFTSISYPLTGVFLVGSNDFPGSAVSVSMTIQQMTGVTR